MFPVVPTLRYSWQTAYIVPPPSIATAGSPTNMPVALGIETFRLQLTPPLVENENAHTRVERSSIQPAIARPPGPVASATSLCRPLPVSSLRRMLGVNMTTAGVGVPPVPVPAPPPRPPVPAPPPVPAAAPAVPPPPPRPAAPPLPAPPPRRHGPPRRRCPPRRQPPSCRRRPSCRTRLTRRPCPPRRPFRKRRSLLRRPSSRRRPIPRTRPCRRCPGHRRCPRPRRCRPDRPARPSLRSLRPPWGRTTRHRRPAAAQLPRRSGWVSHPSNVQACGRLWA